MREKSHGGAQLNWNGGMIKKIEVTILPLAEQERFAVKVARYERLRAQMREAEKQTEMLFQSLLSQSFGGN